MVEWNDSSEVARSFQDSSAGLKYFVFPVAAGTFCQGEPARWNAPVSVTTRPAIPAASARGAAKGRANSSRHANRRIMLDGSVE